MDTIIIEELEVFYRVGVPDEERARPQRLLLSVEISHDFTAASKRDDVRATIDYHAVAQHLRSLGEGREWRLIETVGVEIAEWILREFGALGVTVEVRKFILPQTRHVAVRLTRRRAEL